MRKWSYFAIIEKSACLSTGVLQHAPCAFRKKAGGGEQNGGVRTERGAVQAHRAADAEQGAADRDLASVAGEVLGDHLRLDLHAAAFAEHGDGGALHCRCKPGIVAQGGRSVRPADCCGAAPRGRDTGREGLQPRLCLCPRPCGERADRPEQDTAVRNDIVAGPGLNARHGRDGWLCLWQVVGTERCEGRSQRSARGDGVAGPLRCGAVAAAPRDGDLKAVHGGEDRAGPDAELPLRQTGPDVQRQHARHRNAAEQALLQHLHGARCGLLGGLEQEQDVPGQLLLPRCKQAGCAEQGGHMDIMSAGVHDAGNAGGKFRSGALRDRQGVQIGAQADGGAGQGAAQERGSAGRQTERDRLEAESFQLPADEPGGPVLLPRKLRVFVELRAELMQVRLQRRLLGRRNR